MPKKVRRAAANFMSNSKKPVISKKDDNVVSIKEANKIAELRKALDEQIEKFETKSKLIRDRDQFIQTRDKIMDFIKEQGTDYNPSLDSEQLRLVLQDTRSYRGENVIKISNNEVIRQMLGILLSRINSKILEIEKLILE